MLSLVSNWPFAATTVLITTMAVASTPASAADNDIISKMTAARMERIVQSINLVANFNEVENGIYRFETGGLKVLAFNKGETLQLFAGFKIKPTFSRINEWNRTRRFAKAYINEQGEACLEADLELTGGVTEKNVKEWIKTYILCLIAFKKHLEE